MIIAASLLALIIIVTVIETFIAKQGITDKFPRPDRKPVVYKDTGPNRNYLLLGDSTAAGQGAAYEDGIAVKTAKHLKKKYTVTMVNTGVPGATVAEILAEQSPVLATFKPDIVLLSVGANDTTKLRNPWQVKKELQTLVKKILQTNCEAKIIITGSPDVGSVKRLPFPLNWEISGLSYLLNTIAFKPVVKQYNLTHAPLYEETGPIFRKDPSLLAPDLFHPNAQGYTVWANVLNAALDEALTNQPSHCK